MDITKFSLFDLDGVALWSTDPKTIGLTAKESGLLQKAAIGGTSSKLIKDLQIIDMDGVPGQADVVETYVPLREEAEGRVIGVLEIYRDVTDDVVVLVRDSRSVVLWTTVSTMGGLLLALVGFMALAERGMLRAKEQEDLAQRAQVREHRRADQTEAQFRTVFQSSPLGAAIIDSNGGILESNTAFQKMLGYSEEDLRGMEFRTLTYPDDLPENLDLFEELLAGQRSSYSQEKRYRHKGGGIVPVQLNASILPGAEPVRVIALVEDVTERKKAEEAKVEQAAAIAKSEELQRSRLRLVTVAESLRKGISQRLHGTVQNKLILLLHRLNELKQSPQQMNSAEIEELRRRVEELMENDVRRISLELYPAILRRGIVPALQSLGDQHEPTLLVELSLDEWLVGREKDTPNLIPDQVKIAIYRVAEEAFTNVLKHAKASKVSLILESSDGVLQLAVHDDGHGFDVDGDSIGSGLGTMQDYVDVAGGAIKVRSTPSGGTEVSAAIPVAALALQRRRQGRASP